MRSVIDILDLSVQELDDMIATALDIIDHPAKYAHACEGKKLATLFFEPSTRTRLSFTAAMYELGGYVLGFSEAASSSASKGESVADTAKIVSCYADVIAMRHPREGAALVAARNASIPVINGGDGGHCHPDPGGPSHHPPGAGQAGPSHHRPLRRPQVRPHGPLPHQRHVPP